MFQKVEFKEQLQTLIGEQTIKDFAEKTGVNRTYLSKYLNLRLDKPPSAPLLKSIANNVVTYEDLMISCGYLPTQSFPSKDEAVLIPVIGAVHAGIPSLATEEIESYEYVDSTELSPSHSYFYLRVEGDSMENARIYSGDLVFVRRQENVESGDIAVVMIDNELATLKRVIKKDDTIVLQPENIKYTSMIFTNREIERVHIIGKVLHVKFNL